MPNSANHAPKKKAYPTEMIHEMTNNAGYSFGYFSGYHPSNIKPVIMENNPVRYEPMPISSMRYRSPTNNVRRKTTTKTINNKNILLFSSFVVGDSPKMIIAIIVKNQMMCGKTVCPKSNEINSISYLPNKLLMNEIILQ